MTVSGHGNPGGLLPLPDPLPPPLRYPIPLRMQAAAEVLRSPPLLDPHGPDRAPDVVDVRPVRVEIGGGEGDSLVEAEQESTDLPHIGGVVVEGRHRRLGGGGECGEYGGGGRRRARGRRGV